MRDFLGTNLAAAMAIMRESRHRGRALEDGFIAEVLPALERETGYQFEANMSKILGRETPFADSDPYSMIPFCKLESGDNAESLRGRRNLKVSISKYIIKISVLSRTVETSP